MWHKGLILHPVRRTGGVTWLADGTGVQTAGLVDPLRQSEAPEAHDGELWALERGGPVPDTGLRSAARGVVLWGRPDSRLLPLVDRLRDQGLAAGLRADLVLGRTEEEAGDRAERYSDSYAPDEAAAKAILGALAKPQEGEPGRGIPRGSYLVDRGTTWVGPGSPAIAGGQWSFTFIGTPPVVGAALTGLLDRGVGLCCLGGSAAEAELLPGLIERIEAG
jgi:alkanesulfonate monooxygenase SsuD/methylene tetrahydromethanopterin reductase-like flavin-dependent oxidoreductase (luciferase family)